MESLVYLHSTLFYETAQKRSSPIEKVDPNRSRQPRNTPNCNTAQHPPASEHLDQLNPGEAQLSQHIWPHGLPQKVCCLSVGLAIGTQASPGLADSSSLLLSYGIQDPDVAELQYHLAELGYFESCITGFFGHKTEASVLQFQQDRGLSVDGVVGPTTYSALMQGGETAYGSGSIDATYDHQHPVETIAQSTATAQLQTRLRDLGYYHTSIDGVHGPQTDRAIRQFQASQGLIVDGIPGVQTLERLENISTNKVTQGMPRSDISYDILPPPPPPEYS